MEESKFQEYYQQVKERDEKIANERPLPEAEGVNAWIVFGLSLGIASIVFGFFTKYSIILAIVALALSFVGYRQKKNNVAIAGLICSCVGFFLSIAFAIYRYVVMASLNGTWQNFIDSLQK